MANRVEDQRAMMNETEYPQQWCLLRRSLVVLLLLQIRSGGNSQLLSLRVNNRRRIYYRYEEASGNKLNTHYAFTDDLLVQSRVHV